MPFLIPPSHRLPLTSILGFWLLLTLLLLSSRPAYAEWVKMNENDTFTVCVDPDTIRRKGDPGEDVDLVRLQDPSISDGRGAFV